MGDAPRSPQSGPNLKWHQFVTILIDLAVLGHENQVSCPRTVLLLWLPSQLDQGAFPTWEEQECTPPSLY